MWCGPVPALKEDDPAIANRGALSCMVFEGKFENPEFIEFMRFCRNNVQEAQKCGAGVSRSESQAVELVSCRHDFPTGVRSRDQQRHRAPGDHRNLGRLSHADIVRHGLLRQTPFWGLR